MEKLYSTVSHKALFFYWDRVKEKSKPIIKQEESISSTLHSFATLCPEKVLFVCLMDVTLILEEHVPLDAGKYFYILIDLDGEPLGGYLDSKEAFQQAKEKGYVPQWSH
jgi:hypothetical protein